MVMDSGYRIMSGTGFAGVTEIGIFYEYIDISFSINFQPHLKSA
jgi:hypothetical protein